MLDDLFFCATLTGRRGGYAPFVQAGTETPDTGAEADKTRPRFFLEGSENAESCGVLCPLRISLVICPVRRTYVVVIK